LVAAGGPATISLIFQEMPMIETANLPEVLETLNARIVAIRDSL